jgi:multidrug efflux system outer membrane protein
MTLKIRSISLVIALALAGCASLPSPTLLEGSTTAFAGEPQSVAVAEQWWRALKDPALDHLVDKALAGNLSLKAAGERLTVASRIESVSVVALLPGTSVSATKSRSTAEVDGKANTVSSTSRAAFAVSWEVPLFGQAGATLARARSSRDQAQYQLEASRVSLAAAVVRNYAQLQANLRKLSQTQTSLRALSAAAAIQERALVSGVTQPGELDTVATQVLQATSNLAQLGAENRQLKAALAVLCGETALAEVSGMVEAPSVELLVVAADPARLRARPDVRIAEELVLTAAAQVGLARAALWPQLNLSLNAAVSPISGGLGSTLSAGTLSLPLLNWFALKAQADASVGQMRATVDEYRQVVLSAWQEAEDAHADAEAAASRLSSATRQAAIGRAQLKRVQQLEGAGVASSLEVFSATVAQANMEIAAAEEASRMVQAWARLQKASFSVTGGSPAS